MHRFKIKFIIFVSVTLLALLVLVGCADRNINFVIEFDSNGGTECETIRSEDTASIRIPNDPTRLFYTFDGWYWDDGVWEEPFTISSILDRPISERMNMKVYAKWVGEKFTITLDTGDAEVTAQTVDVRYGEDFVLPVPVLPGEVFEGWYTRSLFFEDNVTDEKGKGTDYAFGTDIIVYPRWKQGGVKIIFDACGGSPVSSRKVWQGETFGELPVPLRTGYTFLGWYTAPDGGEQIQENDIVSFTQDSSLYAQWRMNTYQIVFKDGDADWGSMPSVTLAYEEIGHLPVNLFKKTGYTFTGWSDGTRIYQDEQEISRLTESGVVTLTAQWRPVVFTVVYSAGDGTGSMETQKFTYDVAQKLLKNKFKKTGYRFVCWEANSRTFRDEQSLSNLATTDGAEVLLTARGSPIHYTVVLSKGSADGGWMDKTSFSITYDTEFTLPENGYTYTGYQFSGWYGNENEIIPDGGTVKNLLDYEGTVTLVACWTPNKYTLHFDGNGGTGNVRDMVVEYDKDYSLPILEFTREGYSILCYEVNGKYYFPNRSIPNLTDENDVILTVRVIWIYHYKGCGIASDPYLVDGKEALLSLPELLYLDGSSNTSLSSDCIIRFETDVDLDGALIRPADSYGVYFNGIIDGNGKIISDFVMQSNGENRFGFLCANQGVIRNLNLQNGSVRYEGSYYEMSVGILVGYNNGKIEHCSVSEGTLIFKGPANFNNFVSRIGLFAGEVYADSVIINCYASGSIQAEHPSSVIIAGGFIGRPNGEIISCYADVDLSVIGVAEMIKAGGFCGDSHSMVINCFATGDVSVKAQKEPVYVGRFFPVNYTGEKAEDNYYNSDAAIVVESEAEYTVSTFGNAATDEQLRSFSWRMGHLPTLCISPWQQTDGGYPVFSDGDPVYEQFLIDSKEDFLSLSGKSMFGDYILMTEIDLSNETWVPAVLLGNFYGNGHTISGLSVTEANDGRVGLFASVYGTVSMLALEKLKVDVTVSGTLAIGGIAAELYGEVRACKVEGAILGRSRAMDVVLGALVGVLYQGEIVDCYTDTESVAQGETNVTMAGIVAQIVTGQMAYGYSLGTLSADAPRCYMYGIAEKASYCFSLCDFTYTGKGDVYRVSGNQGRESRETCFCAKSQMINGEIIKTIMSWERKWTFLASTFLTLSFQRNSVMFGEYVSADDMGQNPSHVWVLTEGELPQLYFA